MNNKQIKIGALLSYVAIAVNIISGLIYTPWMVNQIGSANYGVYTLANSIITLFLVDFGLSSAVSRYVAKYRAEGRQDKVDNFLGAIYRLYLIIDAVIFVILLVVYFLIDTIYVKLSPAELHNFKIVYIISAGFAVANFPFVTFNGILNAYEKFIQLKLADIIYRVLLVGITVFALLFDYASDDKMIALVAIHAAIGLLLVIYKFIVIKKSIPLKVNFKYNDGALYKDIFGFSLWVTLSFIAQRLVFSITPTILGATIVHNASFAIAVFGIVTTIEGYTYTMTTAINGMFMPRISRMYEGENAEENIKPLFFTVGKFQYALNGLIIVGFAVVGNSFINLWMSPEYHSAYYGILLIIIPGLFFNSLQIANTAMVVQKKVNIQAYVNIATGVINVILSFILSSKFGVIGACVSIFIAYMVRAFAINIIVWKIMKFDIPAFVKTCYLRMSIPILFTVALGLLMNRLVPDGGWMMLLIKAAAVVAVYLCGVLLIGLESNERSKIIGFIKRKIKRNN